MTQSNQGINRRGFVLTAATRAAGAALASSAAAAIAETGQEPVDPGNALQKSSWNSSLMPR